MNVVVRVYYNRANYGPLLGRSSGRRGLLALALAADVASLELLERAVLGDDLLDVRRRGVLDALAGDRAGEDQRQGVAPLGDPVGAVLGNRGLALGAGLGAVRVGLAHFIILSLLLLVVTLMVNRLSVQIGLKSTVFFNISYFFERGVGGLV